MLRVVIADDEARFRNLIKELVPWEELSLQLIGEAHNGDEAFEMIESEDPDIVLIDVSMPPGITGIEVIRKCIEKGFRTSFVLISGYNQFEFAYQAIKYGVEDYLLKPVQEKELKRVLVHLSDKIKNSRKYFSEGAGDDRDFWQTQKQAILRQHCLMQLAEKNTIGQGMSWEDFDDLYGFNLNDGPVYCMSVHIDVDIEHVDEAITNYLYSGVSHVITSKIENIVQDYEVAFSDRDITILFSTKAPIKQFTVNDVAHAVRLYVESMKSFVSTVSISGPITNPADLSDMIRQTRTRLAWRLFKGSNHVFRDDTETEKDAPDLELVLTNKLRAELKKTIEKQDIDQIPVIIKKVFDNVKIYSSPEATVNAAAEILKLVYLQESEAVDTEKTIGTAYETALNSIHNIATVNELCEYISIKCVYMIQNCSEYLQMLSRRPIAIAKSYIATHYAEDLTLKSMSEMVELSPSYFGLLFKQETGVNFNDHLTDVRIRMSCRELEDPANTILSVARAVGYKDEKYFSKLFKKIMGITPSRYRKLHVIQ